MLTYLLKKLGFLKGKAPSRRFKASYDAARTTLDNYKHWSNAALESAIDENLESVRKTLKARCRYEYHNNCYCRGIIDTLADYVVGIGPTLQILTPDNALNEKIEQLWEKYSAQINIVHLLRLLVISQVRDGEIFLLLTNNNANPITVTPQLIESDLVTSLALTGNNQLTNNNTELKEYEGIFYNDRLLPVAYRICLEHPSFNPLTKTTIFPANLVIHYFRQTRPHQLRGVPEITPALSLFASLRRYTSAVIAAAETAADFAGVLYTEIPPGGEAVAAEPFDPIEIEKRSFLTIPQGWKLTQLKAEQPTVSHKDFVNCIIQEIARSLSIPFNVASGNSSGYNYASGRLDYQAFYRSVEVRRNELEQIILNRILNAFLDEAMLLPGSSIPTMPSDEIPRQWYWPGLEHVDPIKEAQAASIRLASGTTTLLHEYSKQGLDWEDALRQRAKEIKLMEELGILQTEPLLTDQQQTMDEREEDD